MNRSKGVVGVLVALVLPASALAGCGGSSGVSAKAYVNSVCGAVGPFEKDIEARTSALDSSGLSNAQQGKHALQSFMSAAVADANKAVSALKSAGTPNVNNGQQISTAVVSAFTSLKAALATAQTQANALSTSPAAFKAGAQALGSTIRSSVGGISASLNGLKSPELEQAAKSTPSCQALGA